MITSLGTVTLSCNLPSVISVTQFDEDVFDLAICINRSTIYNTTLQACGDTAKFFDLDQIVSQYMLDHRLGIVSLSVEARYERGMESVSTIVVFSNIRTNYTSDTTFLQDNFLTTRTFFRIPRDSMQSVSYFADADGDAHKGIVTAVIRLADDSLKTVSITHNLNFSGGNSIFTFQIRYKYLKSQIQRLYPSSDFSIQEATYKHGNRILTIFFTDEQPAAVMTFLNAFNVEERAHIYGSQSLATDYTKKEAVIQRQTSFYNLSMDQRYKIETVALTLEQALWYNQLLSSTYVRCYLGTTAINQEVLIDDITSDFDLNIGDPIHIKFSYRFTTPESRQVISTDKNVFEPQYDVPFGLSVPP